MPAWPLSSLQSINIFSTQKCVKAGFYKLAKHYYDESIEEMKYAEEVIDRDLYLVGVPEIGRYDVINSGKTPAEQIIFNL